ncbi:hypothetical protein PFICI_08126 [Pestalotiopsis fici W106-1]|uniref:Rhodopsin domain-containing protein n=1 Tax=Pestalotiopsis fici (strain W106-1 / CGMCC3.15140) TaxID=1229662 RepID=W3X5A2_PESFW|nr:uncharacterized protein PFICI_08126 [Pestalotiopsis fici W106-1]ETS80597.1 hypothetical protein PFICI_08126 [Pestalotiopsis fici W106-1]
MSTNISSFAPASWPEPNYINPETRGPAAKIVGCILISLASIVIFLRMWTRQFISKSFGLDDILIVFSYVPATVYAIISLSSEVFLQGNRHIWDVEPRFFSPSLQTSLAELILFDLATNATKLSMLATISRFTTSSVSKKKNTVVLIMATVISLDAFIFLVVVIFQCSPIYAYWTIGLKSKKCINEAAHLLAAGIINTLTEIIVVFLPMKTILKLELPRKQRAIVIGLFATGFLACAAGIARIVFTWLTTSAADHDTVWNAWVLRLASGIELYLGIICASIPAIKPFFATYLPKLIDANIRTSKTSLYLNEPKLPTMTKSNFSDSRARSQTSVHVLFSPSHPLLLPVPEPARPAQQRRLSLSSSRAAAAATAAPTNPLSLSPVVSHKKSLSADLNKPLPTIARHASASSQVQQFQPQLPPPPPPQQQQQPFPMGPLPPPQRSFFDDNDHEDGDEEAGLGLRRQFSTQRNARRFSNSSSVTSTESSNDDDKVDRTTVFIMYQGENEVSGRSFF